jgi:putative transposase
VVDALSLLPDRDFDVANASANTLAPLPDRLLIFRERHLRGVLAQYSVHYNTHRPHRALQLCPPRPQSPVPEPVYERVRRQPVLGG